MAHLQEKMPHFLDDGALAGKMAHFLDYGALRTIAAYTIGGPAGHVTPLFQSAGAACLLHSF